MRKLQFTSQYEGYYIWCSIRIFLSFGFGYETKIAGMSEPSKFHALASEVLSHTPR
jgi:hypothetical protein